MPLLASCAFALLLSIIFFEKARATQESFRYLAVAAAGLFAGAQFWNSTPLFLACITCLVLYVIIAVVRQVPAFLARLNASKEPPIEY